MSMMVVTYIMTMMPARCQGINIERTDNNGHNSNNACKLHKCFFQDDSPVSC